MKNNLFTLISTLSRFGKIFFFLFFIKESCAFEVNCIFNNLPQKCSAITLIKGDKVGFRVKALTHDGKPTIVTYNYSEEKKSVAEFSNTVSLEDAQRGRFSAVFSVGNGVGIAAGAQKDDQQVIIIPVEKVPFAVTRAPDKLQEITIVYKGKEYNSKEPKKLLLKNGDKVGFRVKALTHDGKPTIVTYNYSEEKKSVAEFSNTVSLEDAQRGRFSAVFSVGNGVGTAAGAQKDDQQVIKIPVEKVPFTVTRAPDKLQEILVNVTRARSKEDKLAADTKINQNRLVKEKQYVTPDNNNASSSAVPK